MNMDPFSKSAQDASSLLNPSAPKDIFAKSKPGGGLGRVSKPVEAAEEPDQPEPAPAPEPEKPMTKVVLRNPEWESDKVGFNEEAAVSVELELPQEYAHKTKVSFELFAKTPKGPESISKGEGTAEGGKARCKIPVYIPNFRDEDGNLLQKVEYYFIAKHSESDPLDGSKSPKLVDEMAERLIKTHILPDLTFGFDKSFLHPGQAEALKAMSAEINTWREENPEGKLAVFGHADAVGKEDYNKALSERRARSVLAFLLKDPKAWEDLSKEEKWGLGPVQDLLRHAGHDPGAADGKDGPKTQGAVKGFQADKGLAASGNADESTRAALFQAFMEACDTPALKAKDFDDVNGGPSAGCSEFNLVEKTEGACAANRRVTVLLLKSNKNFPITYPCQKGDVGPCKKQVARKGERRTAGFGCFFYDKLVTETTKPGTDSEGSVRIGLPYHGDHAGPGTCRVKVTSDGKDIVDLVLEDCDRDEDGLVFVSIQKPLPGKLYTISIIHQDQFEWVAIKDYEFHRYVKQLLEGDSDFPRPEVAPWEGVPADDENEADGDTLGDEPYEIDEGRLAGLPSIIPGEYA